MLSLNIQIILAFSVIGDSTRHTICCLFLWTGNRVVSSLKVKEANTEALVIWNINSKKKLNHRTSMRRLYMYD